MCEGLGGASITAATTTSIVFWSENDFPTADVVPNIRVANPSLITTARGSRSGLLVTGVAYLNLNMSRKAASATALLTVSGSSLIEIGISRMLRACAIEIVGASAR